MSYDIIVGRGEADKKAFGDKALVSIGKGYVKMGQYTSLSNKILMDVARSHVVLVAGKRGSGKCLHGDTLITLGDGSQIPIKELEKNKGEILSLDENLKIKRSPKSDFFSREVNNLIKIKLRSGKEIKLTPEHPLLTIKGWQETRNLTVGSRIATPRETCFGDEEMPEHEIKLLAYLLAEGHTKKVVLFSNNDEKIVEEFEYSLNQFDKELELKKEKEGCHRIANPNWKNKILVPDKRRNQKGQFVKGSKNTYEKRSIRRLIEREGMFGLLATEKFISKSIMKLKRKQLALFLNRLFSCDGSIYRKETYKGKGNYWEVSYSSSSKKLIKQIQTILLKFRILSKIRSKKMKCKDKIFPSYELHINSSNSLKFIGQIGFFGQKEKRQEIAKDEIILTKKNTNIDTIPKEIWETYTPKNWAAIGRAMGYKYPKATRERTRYSPSRQTLLQVAKVEQHNPLYKLATSDIFWDEIISMEILDGNFKVYDICVPGDHNFVANDIIVHNSYTLGVIAEELSNLPKETSQNLSSLIFDTMGIYWTMKFQNKKDKEILNEYGLKAKNLPVKVFVPAGHFDSYLERGIPADEKFALDISEMNAEDWILTFNLDITHPIAVSIERAITKLKEQEQYYIEEIISEIEKDERTNQEIKDATTSLFEAANTWGVFAKKGEKPTQVNKLINRGTTSILDLSVYNAVGAFNVRALTISLVSRKIFNQRMAARKKEEIEAVSHGLDILINQEKKETPLVWIFIDEAHEFLPKEEKTLATDALIQLLREGRQPGISLVLATQQPGKIHTDVMTQSDIVISHRVTSQSDLEALNKIMQTYLLESIKQYMDDLPSLSGSAIILDDNSERIYPMRIRPRFTWHGGEAPTAIKPKKEL